MGDEAAPREAADEARFRRLVAEAWAVEPRGWDFSALAGRVVTEPLPWDYVTLARTAVARASRVLDVDTGGGEVLAALGPPPGSIAVEPYPPTASAGFESRPTWLVQTLSARVPSVPGAGRAAG